MINWASRSDACSPAPTNSTPRGITAGPDGNLWFTEFGVGKIGEINPATHVITEFPIPYSIYGPAGITTGPDGNLWFTDATAGNTSIGLVTLNQTSSTHL